MVGGKIKPLTEAVVGAESILSMKGLNFSKAFMGTNGIDLSAGYTTPDLEEARIKEAAINTSYMAFYPRRQNEIQESVFRIVRTAQAVLHHHGSHPRQ